jgi:hypothetical protein
VFFHFSAFAAKLRAQEKMDGVSAFLGWRARKERSPSNNQLNIPQKGEGMMSMPGVVRGFGLNSRSPNLGTHPRPCSLSPMLTMIYVQNQQLPKHQGGNGGEGSMHAHNPATQVHALPYLKLLLVEQSW